MLISDDNPNYMQVLEYTTLKSSFMSDKLISFVNNLSEGVPKWLQGVIGDKAFQYREDRAMAFADVEDWTKDIKAYPKAMRIFSSKNFPGW